MSRAAVKKRLTALEARANADTARCGTHGNLCPRGNELGVWIRSPALERIRELNGTPDMRGVPCRPWTSADQERQAATLERIRRVKAEEAEL